MVLPPGVTAKRRLRAFKVYVLVHTRRIIICHPTITHRKYSLIRQINNLNLFSVIACIMIVSIATTPSWHVLYLHRRRARGCHVGFGPRVGHLGIFDIGIFPLLHLIPLQSDKMTRGRFSLEDMILYKALTNCPCQV